MARGMPTNTSDTAHERCRCGAIITLDRALTLAWRRRRDGTYTVAVIECPSCRR